MEWFEVLSVLVFVGLLLCGLVYIAVLDCKTRMEIQKREHEQRLKELSMIIDGVRKMTYQHERVLDYIAESQGEKVQAGKPFICPRCGRLVRNKQADPDDDENSAYMVARDGYTHTWLCKSCFFDLLPNDEECFGNWYIMIVLRRMGVDI